MVSKMLQLSLRLTLSLVLLATVINGFEALERTLEKMAKNGNKIDNLFVPSENGTIKCGGYSLVFKGKKPEFGLSVALKFVRVEHRNVSDNEFRIYGYLNAINKTHVEEYGIPTLYYYNEWNGYMLTVLSFFDGGDLDDLFSSRYFNHKNASLAVNSFLLFRDFVIQSKYMHSRGVRHDDIKPGNIAVRGRRSFLIDFNSASKMTEDQWSGTQKFIPRKLYNHERRTPKSDWESFLYTMAYINGIELGWLFVNSFQGQNWSHAKQSVLVEIFMKNDTQHIMSKIINAPFASQRLKRIFIRFASEALNSQDLNPSYDAMLEFIESEMGSKFEPDRKTYKVFTWLEGCEREMASRELVDTDIRNINVPRNFEGFKYDEYPLDYFSEAIIIRGCPFPLFGSCSFKKINN